MWRSQLKSAVSFSAHEKFWRVQKGRLDPCDSLTLIPVLKRRREQQPEQQQEEGDDEAETFDVMNDDDVVNGNSVRLVGRGKLALTFASLFSSSCASFPSL